MKPKGINPFELHVEKIVLGVAALVVFGLAAKAFFTDPNAVTIDSQTLSPSKVDDLLARKADELKGKLNSPEGIATTNPGELTAWFNDRLAHPQQPLTDGTSVALLRGAPIQTSGGVALTVTSDQYAAFDAPPPTDLKVASLSYTLDPGEIDKYADLARHFPDKKPPYDIEAVHIVATYSGKQLHAALMKPVADKKVIPAAWISDETILDVVAQRQELLPDGTWGPIEEVKTIPGQNSLRSTMSTASYRDKDAILTQAQQLGKELYEPPFYTLLGGQPWTRDDMRKGLPKSPEQIEAEKQMNFAWMRVQDTQDRLDRFEEALKKAAERDKNKPGQSFNPQGKGEGGGGPVSGTEGGASQQGGKDDKAKDPVEMRRTEYKANIVAAQKAYEESKSAVLKIEPGFDEFPDLKEGAKKTRTTETGPIGKGIQEGGMPIEQPLSPEGPTIGFEGGGGSLPVPKGVRGKGRPMGERGSNQMAAEFFDNDSITVWAHDIDVKPGATYRYRLEVGLLNPFLGREDRLTEAQKKMAGGFVALSEPTAWSDPVLVMSDHQFFAVGGSYSDNFEDRTASFEIYTFTNGKHLALSVSAHPGDPIGEARTYPGSTPEDKPTDVNFSTGAVLLDVLQYGPRSANPLDQKVRIVVAMPDGSIRVFDPSAQATDADRVRLKDISTNG